MFKILQMALLTFEEWMVRKHSLFVLGMQVGEGLSGLLFLVGFLGGFILGFGLFVFLVAGVGLWGVLHYGWSLVEVDFRIAYKEYCDRNGDLV